MCYGAQGPAKQTRSAPAGTCGCLYTACIIDAILSAQTGGEGSLKQRIKVGESNHNLAPKELATPASDSLPEFARPPVTEVALSLQFEPLAKLKSPVIGLLWGKFKDRYPAYEEQPAIEPVIERFGTEALQNFKIQFQVFDAPPPSRVWFVNESGSELVQVQQDRFVHNWRKVHETDEYPRYRNLRQRLIDELEMFRGFVEKEQLGELLFNQSEVTFVNIIVSGEGWERHGQLNNILTIHSGNYSDDFFNEPENVQTALRYVIPGENDKPAGRLHVSIVPVVLAANKTPGFNLTLTARCAPNGSLEDAIRCLDLGHRWIVKGFASITTKDMHRIWERQNEQ